VGGELWQMLKIDSNSNGFELLAEDLQLLQQVTTRLAEAEKAEQTTSTAESTSTPQTPPLL
jgi:hypothetical protein